MLLIMGSGVDALSDGFVVYVCGFPDIYSYGCFHLEKRTDVLFDSNYE